MNSKNLGKMKLNKKTKKHGNVKKSEPMLKFDQNNISQYTLEQISDRVDLKNSDKRTVITFKKIDLNSNNLLLESTNHDEKLIYIYDRLDSVEDLKYMGKIGLPREGDKKRMTTCYKIYDYNDKEINRYFDPIETYKPCMCKVTDPKKECQIEKNIIPNENPLLFLINHYLKHQN